MASRVYAVELGDIQDTLIDHFKHELGSLQTTLPSKLLTEFCNQIIYKVRATVVNGFVLMIDESVRTQ